MQIESNYEKSAQVPWDQKKPATPQTSQERPRPEAFPRSSPDSDSMDLQKLGELASSMEEYTSSLKIELKFNLDREAKEIQVEIINSEKEEVIRKIPPDELLHLSKSIKDMLGIIMNRNL